MATTDTTLPAAAGALLYPQDWRWNADAAHGTACTITYSFMTSNPGTYVDFEAFSAADKAGAREALAEWAKVCNVTFKEVTSGGQIAFGNADVNGASGVTHWKGTSGAASGLKITHADIYMNSSQNLSYADGGFGLRALLHEIGHALGLKHTFDTTGTTLSGVQNTAQYSVMSYANPPATPNAQPHTPQLYDIAAAQHLYGANTATNADDTTYQFSNTKTNVMTIWDGAGNDRLDASNQSVGCTLDLRTGHFSSIGVYNGGAAKSNIAIAEGAIIENATGGSGNDLLIGNEAANVLAGGRGNDTYVIGSPGDKVVEASGQGVDTVHSTLSVTLGTYLENLVLTGTGAINGTGSAGNNTITGNDAANILTGKAGHDVLTGGGGNDTFKYLSTADLTYPGAKGDTITDFTTGADKLWFDDVAFKLATGQAKAGINFVEIAATFTGTNSTASDFAAGKASLVQDSTGTLYYDANGKAAGHYVVATLQAGIHLHAADIIIA